ncbi:MAG: hypothetical protein AAB281_05800, partial [Actinomycetota bacterium]
GEPVELVNVRLTAAVAQETPPLETPTIETAPRETKSLEHPLPDTPQQQTRRQERRQDGPSATRLAYFKGKWLEAAVWRREELGAARPEGPAIIEEDEATTVVTPGWGAYLDSAGNLWLKAGAQ